MHGKGGGLDEAPGKGPFLRGAIVRVGGASPVSGIGDDQRLAMGAVLDTAQAPGPGPGVEAPGPVGTRARPADCQSCAITRSHSTRGLARVGIGPHAGIGTLFGPHFLRLVKLQSFACL